MAIVLDEPEADACIAALEALEDCLDDVLRQEREPQDPAGVALRDVLGVADLADRGVDA